MAAAVGDPRPAITGGPDSQAMIDWHARWGRVERALKLGEAAAGMARAINALDPDEEPEAHRALDEWRHQWTMLSRGL